MTADLVLVNRGNVEVTVPREDKFCVFADDGLTRAMYTRIGGRGWRWHGSASIESWMNSPRRTADWCE